MNDLSIVHITSVHHPLDTRIFYKECKTLSQNGYNVYLIAQSSERSTLEESGINFIEVPPAKSKFERFYKVIPSIYNKLKQFEVNSTAIHFHDPELIPLALVLKARGYIVTYDIHEDSSASIGSRDWIPKLIRKPVSLLVQVVEKTASNFFDNLITVTPHIKSKFNENKTTLIQNFPLTEDFSNTNTNNYTQRSHHFLYVGDITPVRGIFEMVQAMSYVPDKYNAVLNICGTFSPPKLKQEAQNTRGWDKCNFMGWVERKELSEVFSNSRAGLVLFHPLKNHINAQPNKMFEYMGAGLPLIASDFPLWRNIIERQKCGLLVDPLNPKEIGDALIYILENQEEAKQMGIRGKEAVKNNYNWENEGKKLVELYSKY